MDCALHGMIVVVVTCTSCCSSLGRRSMFDRMLSENDESSEVLRFDRLEMLVLQFRCLAFVEFIIAAFRRRSPTSILLLVHLREVFGIPRLAMWVVGVAYGRLSLEVMRFRRSLLFFFCIVPDPSPSTSVFARGLLCLCRMITFVVTSEKMSFLDGMSSVKKGKVCRFAPLLAEYQSNIILSRCIESVTQPCTPDKAVDEDVVEP